MLKGLIGLLILCLECVTCFSSLFSGGIESIELLSKEFGRLNIQGVWTELRFPLSSYEVSGSWSYRLAGKATAISVVWVQKWRLSGGGLWAAAVTPNHWFSLSFKVY
ncbi:hypothetical protein Bca101_086520 [Brassica carinata]